jgi:hypothetical protein
MTDSQLNPLPLTARQREVLISSWTLPSVVATAAASAK